MQGESLASRADFAGNEVPWPSDLHCPFKMLISWKNSENHCLDLRKAGQGKRAGCLEKMRASLFGFFSAVKMTVWTPVK